MSGFNTNDQQQQKFQVSTNLLSMFDGNSHQLKIGGLESALSFAIWIPVPGENGRNTYPQDHRFSVVLSPERVAALDYILTSKILPAMTEGAATGAAIFTNRGTTNMIQIEIIDETGDPVIKLHMDIDQETRIAKNTYQFHFDKSMMLTRYDAATGDYDVQEVHAAFFLFCNCVHMFALDGCTGSTSHAHRYNNRFSTDKIFRYLEGIAQKLGVVVASNTYGRSGGGGAPSGFSNSQTQGGGQPMMPQMQESDNLADLLL